MRILISLLIVLASYSSLLLAQDVEVKLIADTDTVLDFADNPSLLKGAYSNKSICRSFIYKFGNVQGGYRGGDAEFQVLITNNSGSDITILKSFRNNSPSFSAQATDEIAGVMETGTYQIWTITFNTKNKIGPQNRWIDLQTVGKKSGKAIIYRIYFVGNLLE
jgi:hypothetical protein